MLLHSKIGPMALVVVPFYRHAGAKASAEAYLAMRDVPGQRE